MKGGFDAMAKGDDARRRRGHSSPKPRHEMLPISPGEYEEARRTLAVLTARQAIGAESGEQAKVIMAQNPEMEKQYYAIFNSLKGG